MRRAGSIAFAARVVAAFLLARSPALAHGASKGLHLHVIPGEALPGAGLEVDADAALPIVRLRIGFVGETPVEIRPDPPAKRVVTKLSVPNGAKAGTATNVVAEAEAGTGKVFRASGILRVLKPPAPAGGP